MVQLGSLSRLRTILDTNISMSYARGHWESIERNAAAMPWLRYAATLDDRTRPAHRAWHGTVLRYDHPFWRSHYPPNGWHCRCTVLQYSDADLKRRGFTPSDGPPPGSDKTRQWLNKRTGEVHQVPRGIDPDFQHNAGRVDLGEDTANFLIQRIDSATPDAEPDEKSWRIDNSKEIELVHKLKRTLLLSTGSAREYGGRSTGP